MKRKGKTNFETTPQVNGTNVALVTTKLDDLGACDDNTDKDATTNAHGLCPKLGGGTTNFFRADGTWADPGGSGAPASSITEATGTITTSSTSYVQATSMTVTPAAGTYMVWFTGSVTHSAASASIWCTVYSAGSQVTSSEREFEGAAHGATCASFTCVARVTVNGAQAIEGRWKASGATASMHERSLALIKVT